MYIPGLAAYGGSEKNREIKSNSQVQFYATSQFGSQATFNKLPGFFHAGTVARVEPSNFGLQTTDGTELTVDVGGAKLIRLPNTSISISDIAIGDRVWVQGARSEDKIAASIVYDIAANVKPSLHNGEVTAIEGDKITIETEQLGKVSITTNDNTEVKQAGENVSAKNIQVGSKIKVFGLWDKINDFFSAIRIKLK
jgi:hypothetical protein